MLLTGAGKSETLHARWEDVDIENGVLCTNKTFTGRTYLIPINSEAIKPIRSLTRKEGSQWLFTMRTGNRLMTV